MTHKRSTSRGVVGLSGGLLVALTLAGTQTSTLAQGCVAVRGSSACMLHPGSGTNPDDANLSGGDWIASVSERYLHSHRHFVGDQEQKQRQAGATEVNNHSNFIDLGVQYAFSPRYSAALALPMSFSDRSQRASPAGFPSYRYETHASGIGDARLTAYAWLWDPAKFPKGNIQIGLGSRPPLVTTMCRTCFPR